MLHLILTPMTRALSTIAMNGIRNLLIHIHKCQGLRMDILTPPSSIIAPMPINLQASTKLSRNLLINIHKCQGLRMYIIIPPSSAIAPIQINLQASTKLSRKHLMDITILIIIVIVFSTQMPNHRLSSIFPALHTGTTILIHHNPIIHLIKSLVQCHQISFQIPMKLL